MLEDHLQHLSPLCKADTYSVMNFPAKMQCWGEETYARCRLAADGAHQDALEQLSKPSWSASLLLTVFPASLDCGAGPLQQEAHQY